MPWIFAAVVLYLAVADEGFRKVLFWIMGIGAGAFAIFMVLGFSGAFDHH